MPVVPRQFLSIFDAAGLLVTLAYTIAVCLPEGSDGFEKAKAIRRQIASKKMALMKSPWKSRLKTA